jgi:Spy/CpxP family protein refolding chaperone
MKKVQLAGIITAGLIFAGTPALFAKQPCPNADMPEFRHEMRGDMPEKMHERLMQELNLTTDQKARMKQSRELFRNQTKQLMQELQDKREALRQELDRTTTDRSRVTALSSDIKSLTSQLMDVRIQSVLELKDILTPDQYAKLMQKREDFRERRGGKHDGDKCPDFQLHGRGEGK